MKPKDIMVATHGHCFDGMASAALFSNLVSRLRSGTSLAIRYRSCGYGPGMSMIPEEWLDGVENAILDFRYTPSKRLSWYFDHHITGFGSAEERDRALQDAAPPSPEGSAPQVFYNAAYGSCTKLIADVAREHFNITMPELSELITWADIIDTARFPSAEAATSRAEPVMQLASVVEHHGDGPFLATVVPQLLTKPVREVAQSPEIQALWKPLEATQELMLGRVKKGAQARGRVVLVDLTDAPLEAAAKFVTYALFPESVYSVVLARARNHYKLSIGYNPWCGAQRQHDISSICRRYGGGGHPAVGAASFPLNDLERAKQAAASVTEELNA